jgi:hypothetical protein
MLVTQWGWSPGIRTPSSRRRPFLDLGRLEVETQEARRGQDSRKSEVLMVHACLGPRSVLAQGLCQLYDPALDVFLS